MITYIYTYHRFHSPQILLCQVVFAGYPFPDSVISVSFQRLHGMGGGLSAVQIIHLLVLCYIYMYCTYIHTHNRSLDRTAADLLDRVLGLRVDFLLHRGRTVFVQHLDQVVAQLLGLRAATRDLREHVYATARAEGTGLPQYAGACAVQPEGAELGQVSEGHFALGLRDLHHTGELVQLPGGRDIGQL